MSAVEKLKALDAARGEFAWEESIQKFSLFDALPQILAVVEAAERECGYDCIDGVGHYDLTEKGGGDIGRVLAALDEQLGDLGSPPTSERSTAQ